MGPLQAVYLGIDPGASGAITFLICKDGERFIEDEIAKQCGTRGIAEPIPTKDIDLLDMLIQLSIAASNGSTRIYAVLEKVGGYIKGNPTPGSAMFNFGAGVGRLRMALLASGIPYVETPPQVWQSALRIPPRGRLNPTETKQEFKQRLVSKARLLFPQENITARGADSVLLAEYCRMTQEGVVLPYDAS